MTTSGHISHLFFFIAVSYAVKLSDLNIKAEVNHQIYTIP